MWIKSEKNKITAAFRAGYVVLAVLLLAVSCLYGFRFSVGCLICLFLFSIIQVCLIFISHKDNYYQQKKCKLIGFVLLVPSLGMIANGILLIFSDVRMPDKLSYALIVGMAVMAVGSLAHIYIYRKDSSLAARFMRFVDCASLSAPVSLTAFLELSINNDESVVAIGCMTAVLLGGIALLIAFNMILTSLYGYVGTRDVIKLIIDFVSGKKLSITRAMLVKDGILVAGKMLISLISLSFFMFANGLYSVGMGAGRYIAIQMHFYGEEEQIKSYRRVGGIILFSSTCYVLYSIRLFFGGSSMAFPMVIAISIACYTFVEFGINIREMIRLRKSRALEAKALRALSFSSTLLCFVLTQTAIVSFTYEGNANFYNAVSGVAFGGLAALVGLFMIFQI